MHLKIKQLFRASIKFNPYFGWLAFHPYIIIILPKYKLYVTDVLENVSLVCVSSYVHANTSSSHYWLVYDGYVFLAAPF